jgi:Holliday junction resolvase
MSGSKGSRGENELGHLFSQNGFAWIRTAGSGTAGRELPDITVGDGDRLIVMEVKRWSNKAEYEYLSKEEVEDLIYFAENFGAEYYIAVRFDYRNWQFFKKDEMKETNKSYRIDNVKSDQIQRTIEDVCQQVKKN